MLLWRKISIELVPAIKDAPNGPALAEVRPKAQACRLGRFGAGKAHQYQGDIEVGRDGFAARFDLAPHAPISYV